eukprot:2149382-Alexandrium_andersonii.AAC.1
MVMIVAVMAAMVVIARGVKKAAINETKATANMTAEAMAEMVAKTAPKVVTAMVNIMVTSVVTKR